MPGTNIQHVNLQVGDLDAAVAFYTDVIGLGLAPTPDLGLPAQFIAINDYQEIHLNQSDDVKPERAHFCLRVADFNGGVPPGQGGGGDREPTRGVTPSAWRPASCRCSCATRPATSSRSPATPTSRSTTEVLGDEVVHVTAVAA